MINNAVEEPKLGLKKSARNRWSEKSNKPQRGEHGGHLRDT